MVPLRAYSRGHSLNALCSNWSGEVLRTTLLTEKNCCGDQIVWYQRSMIETNAYKKIKCYMTDAISLKNLLRIKNIALGALFRMEKQARESSRET